MLPAIGENYLQTFCKTDLKRLFFSDLKKMFVSFPNSLSLHVSHWDFSDKASDLIPALNFCNLQHLWEGFPGAPFSCCSNRYDFLFPELFYWDFTVLETRLQWYIVLYFIDWASNTGECTPLTALRGFEEYNSLFMECLNRNCYCPQSTLRLHFYLSISFRKGLIKRQVVGQWEPAIKQPRSLQLLCFMLWRTKTW